MIIFLDIDGVLVPAKSWKKPEILNDGFPEFSTNAVETLNCIIDIETKIFLTTSHKSRFSVNQWKEIFKKRNLHTVHIEKLEDNSERLNRREEIEKWFKNSNSYPENFIILDDDKSLNDLPVELKRHLVLTSPTIGLTDTHLDKMREILQLRTPVGV